MYQFKINSAYVAQFNLYNWDISCLGFNLNGYSFSYVHCTHLSPNIYYNPTLPHSITPSLPSLFTLPDPIIQTLHLNAHLNLIPLINVHSFEFKLMIGIFVLGIFGLIVSFIDFTFGIIKNLILNGYGDGTKTNPNGESEHSKQWKEYTSNNPVSEKRALFIIRGLVWYDVKGVSRRDGGNGGDEGGGKRGPNDKGWQEIYNQAVELLERIRTGYIIHAYITNHAYNSEGNENRPDLMEDLRRSGIFELYGIHDRFGHPNVDISEWPYPLTTTNDWYQLYERMLDFIITRDDLIMDEPLPGTPALLIQAAQRLGLPPIHTPQAEE